MMQAVSICCLFRDGFLLEACEKVRMEYAHVSLNIS
jgi:hypothetical protein